jgi:hypothetical protein
MEHVEKTWPLTRELRIILHEARAEIERQAGTNTNIAGSSNKEIA